MKKYFLITFLFLIASLNFAQYNLDYTGAQLDTALAVLRAKIYRQTQHGFQVPYSTIQAAITASDSGDCVHIRTGYYSLGSDSLKLKNGVDLFCEPHVTIHSTNANKTISDGNVQLTCGIYGFPTITNSNGLDKRIVRSNVLSKIDGFYWEYSALITTTGTSPSLAWLFVNTLGGTPTWTRNSAGNISFTLTGAFTGTRTVVYFDQGFYKTSYTRLYVDCYANYINIYVDGTDEYNTWYGEDQTNMGVTSFRRIDIKSFP